MLIAVFLLLIMGMLALWSISFQDATFNPTNFVKQLTSIGIGLALLFFFSFYDYRVLNSWSTKFYFIILTVLVLVIFWGTTIRGTTGWIGVGSFHIQPVEIAKLVLIIFLASFLSKKKTEFSIVVRTIVSVVLIFLPVFLILKQPDFGSAAIIIGVWGILILISGISKKNFLVLLLITVIALTSGWLMLKDYQRERISNLVHPEQDPQGSGYNVLQSIVAVGSGGFFGKGLGHGSQSQLNFLPEKHTDFIFAVIAEELGFLGSAAILTLFGILFYRMKETARLARDNFGYLLSVGVMSMVFLQFLVNIGMNMGIMPVTGVPLPFLSYGGSSLVTTLASIGILESIYMRRAEAVDL